MADAADDPEADEDYDPDHDEELLEAETDAYEEASAMMADLRRRRSLPGADTDAILDQMIELEKATGYFGSRMPDPDDD